MKLRRLITATTVLLCVGPVACSGDGATENTGTPGIRVLFGAGVTDTIDAVPLQALVVELRTPRGKPARRTPVRFEARPPTDPARQSEPALFVCSVSVAVCGPNTGTAFVVDSTDDNGVARAMVRLGHIAGRAVVRISSANFIQDSVAYVVTHGAAVSVRAPAADTLLLVGTVTTLPGKLYDRYNNLRPDVPTTSAGIGSAVSLEVPTSAVTANTLGVQRLYFRSGTMVDSTTVTVLPAARLVAWIPGGADVVHLFNIDGSAVRVLSTRTTSNLGVFPRFDRSRQLVTLHTGEPFANSQTLKVVDTLGTTLRTIPNATGFNWVIAQRQLADGSIMVVGQRSGQLANAVWRVAADNNITAVATLPGADSSYNSGRVQNTGSVLNSYNAYGAADVSPDGTRIAYVAGPPQLPEFSLRVLNIVTGTLTILYANARAPRWSQQGDQIAFLLGRQLGSSPIAGFPNIIKVDGTGRREVGSFTMEAGIGWSPDGLHLIGRDQKSKRLRVLNISTGATVLLSRLKSDYYQPDWR